MNINGQSWLVLGAGKSGRGAVRLLLTHGARVTWWDRHPSEPSHREGLPGADARLTLAHGESYPQESFAGCVISPGISLGTPEARYGREVAEVFLGEVELASRFHNADVVAVTGTNGKSTTTELIGVLLHAVGKKIRTCGNIGLPFSEAVLDASDTEIFVVEVSSFQLETIIEFHPRVAVYLNLASDHLDRYPDLVTYGKAKERIFKNQGTEDTAILQWGLVDSLNHVPVITFHATRPEADWTLNAGWLCRRGEGVVEINNTPLSGPHNAENLMAALATVEALGEDVHAALKGMGEFRSLPHRCEWVGQVDGIDFINDSKATNPSAMAQAIQSVEGPVILIAGGRNKGFDFRPLAGLVAELCRRVILIGEAREDLMAAWSDWVVCKTAGSLTEAVHAAYSQSAGIRTVLLSPGCASFDMFNDFEDRGNQFREIVQSLKNQPEEKP